MSVSIRKLLISPSLGGNVRLGSIVCISVVVLVVFYYRYCRSYCEQDATKRFTVGAKDKLKMRNYIVELKEKNPFDPVLSVTENATLSDLVWKFSEVAQRENINFMLYGGTLIGSWRHHGPIPWDDDADVWLSFNQKRQITAALKKLHPNYLLYDAKDRLKLYSKNSIASNDYQWRWPFLDISFYKQDRTHVWDIVYSKLRYVYRRELIFPIKFRPYESGSLPVPYDVYGYLLETYGPTFEKTCTASEYSHKVEDTISNKHPSTIDCATLADKYPFVHRSIAGKLLKEQLLLNNNVSSTRLVDDQAYIRTWKGKSHHRIIENTR